MQRAVALSELARLLHANGVELTGTSVRQIAAKEELAKVRSISKKQRQGNVRYRTGRDGRAQREALLQTKSHRRESRTKANQEVRSMALTNADEDDDLL